MLLARSAARTHPVTPTGEQQSERGSDKRGTLQGCGQHLLGGTGAQPGEEGWLSCTRSLLWRHGT